MVPASACDQRTPGQENPVHIEERQPVLDRPGRRPVVELRRSAQVDSDWSWPPYAPVAAVPGSFETPEWAPSSTVWHPRLRVGRWTVLYRRSA